MISRLNALCAVLFLAICSAAHGQLAWEKTQIDLRPKPGDAQAVAQFRYENKGDTPVRITGVKSSCGCTVAKPTKEVIAPGEKGEITATFNIGGRTGLQNKMITVMTDHPAQPVANLVLSANIAQPIEMQPAFVYWQNGEAPKPKTIKVTAADGIAISKLDVSSSDPQFKVDVKRSSPREYLVSVQPQGTSTAAQATLTISPDYPQKLQALARVLPAGSAGVTP